MLLGTRADWQQHMLRARNQLGFTGVRGHGILDDDMSVIIDSQYHWYNVDVVRRCEGGEGPGFSNLLLFFFLLSSLAAAAN